VKYVNPLSLLGIQPFDIASLDTAMVKKLRRKLFAEIELSDDGAFHLDGVSYTRSECEKALDSIEDQANLKYHAYLLNNRRLLAFLNNGDPSIFQGTQLESVYLDGGFQSFISHFFAPRYDKALLEAFKTDVTDTTGLTLRTGLDNVLRLSVLVTPSHESIAYRSLTSELQSRVAELEKLTEEINEEESEYGEDNSGEITALVRNLIPVHSLNKLPAIFQSTRNKLASQANYLQLAVWNILVIPKVSHDILEHLLTLDIESASKPTFERNFTIVREKYLEQLEQDKHKYVVHHWALYMKTLTELNNKVNNKFVKPGDIELDLLVDDLNNLGSFADEIRDTVAKRVRELSISVWNNYKDHAKSMQLIQLSCSIRTTKEVRDQLLEDQKQLTNLRAQSVEVSGSPIKSAPTLYLVNGCGSTLYGSTLYFVIFGIPIFPFARYNYESFGNQYRFHGKLKLHNYQVVWRYIVLAVVVYFVLNVLINS